MGVIRREIWREGWREKIYIYKFILAGGGLEDRK